MKRLFNVIEKRDDDFITEGETGLRWHRSKFRVLYADTDKAGVVYHANYLKYFEIGRSGLIRASGQSYREIEAMGLFHPIVDLRVLFESSADYDEELSVYARPRELAPVKFSYDYLVRNDAQQRVIAHGFTVHCCIDRNRKVLPVDPVTKAIFAAFDMPKTIK